MSLAAALAAGGGSLHSLDMSGCELTDTAAAALAGLLAAAPAAEAPAAAVGGFRSPLKWRSAAAAVPAEERVQLQELRLVDNQITSAGAPTWWRHNLVWGH
jgi:anti-sigma factor RsiW